MKRNVLLCILTGVAFLALAFAAVLMKNAGTHLLHDSEIDCITRIEVSTRPDSYPLTLEKISGNWKIVLDDTHRYPANNARISAFLDELAQKSVISRVQGDDGSRYGTNGDLSYRFRIFGSDGDLYLDIATGRMGTLEQYGYFYDYRNDAVYRTESNLFSFRDTSTAFWADLDPFEEKLHGKEIELIRYLKDDTISEIARISGEKESAKTDLIDDIERRLRSLRCIDITNIPANANERILIELNDASCLNLAIAFAGSDHCIVRDESTGESWVITGSSYTDLIQGF